VSGEQISCSDRTFVQIFGNNTRLPDGRRGRDPVEWTWAYLLRAKPMRKLVLASVLVASQGLFLCSSVWAQSKLTKGTTARTDNCAPIGRTANGELVYSMRCETLPAPAAPPPQAELKEAAPPPEPEVRRSGLFGMSYEVKQPER
jgi:hypothetical protein